jgi:hypothetical protein
MDDANDVLIEALLDDVLDESLVTDSVDEALRLLQGDDDSDRLSAIEAQIAKVDRERTRLVTAIATAGGPLDGLLEERIPTDGLRGRPFVDVLSDPSTRLRRGSCPR